MFSEHGGGIGYHARTIAGWWGMGIHTTYVHKHMYVSMYGHLEAIPTSISMPLSIYLYAYIPTYIYIYIYVWVYAYIIIFPRLLVSV